MEFYMLSFTVNGVKNISKDIRLDFYKKTIDKSFNPEKYRVKAIYGENGSGKSAIITAVKILKDIISDNRYLSDYHNQSVLSELINKKTNHISLETEIRIQDEPKNMILKYTIELEKRAREIVIKRERLEEKNANYATSTYEDVFRIEDGSINELKMEVENQKYCMNRTMNLLNFQSFISTTLDLYRDNHEILKDWGYQRCFYAMIFARQIDTYLDDPDQHQGYTMNKYINEPDDSNDVIDSIFKDKLFNGINSKLVHIHDFEDYEKRVQKLCGFIQIFKTKLISIDIDKKIRGDFYDCELIMNYGDYSIHKEFESTGIKKIIHMFDCFSNASDGKIVFIDELDSNINDVYLCRILEYFMYYGKGQLCFTTHNLDPMNILKHNKNSINFLSSVSTIHNWTSSGNASPENYYKNGMIEDLPFNIDATDFIGILGDDE